MTRTVLVCGDLTNRTSRRIGEAIARLGGLGTRDKPLVVTTRNFNDLAMAMYGCVPPILTKTKEDKA